MAAACLNSSSRSFSMSSGESQISNSICRFDSIMKIPYSCRNTPSTSNSEVAIEVKKDHFWVQNREEAQSAAAQEPVLSKYYCSTILSRVKKDHFWVQIREEAHSAAAQEPVLSKYYCSTILSHDSLELALARLLASKLSDANLSADILADVVSRTFAEDKEIRKAFRADLQAVKDRDPAWISYIHCLLNLKGFLGCQAYRVGHKLWSQGRIHLALVFQSRISEVFGMDIHPGAQIGHGILFDHGTGIVIGETAVIKDNVTILHNVTLGGTGKVSGDRHPKIGKGVLIGSGAKVLGNIRVGEGAKVGAGAVVLKEVPARTTVVGNPARFISKSCY